MLIPNLDKVPMSVSAPRRREAKGTILHFGALLVMDFSKRQNDIKHLLAFVFVIALGVGAFISVDRATNPRTVTSQPAWSDANLTPDRSPATGGQAK